MMIARAPVRISFGGGGTDLAAYYARHGGFVVSAAITRYSYVAVSQPETPRIQLTSADYRRRITYPLAALDVAQASGSIRQPLALPKAALAEWAEFVANADQRALLQRGADLYLTSEVQPGTGLGSSSAMACALTVALAGYSGMALTAAEVAEAACRIEIERLRAPIGRQDQYASAFGGLNAITFTADGVRVTPLHLPGRTLRQLEQRLLLFASGQTRSANVILRRQRRATQTRQDVVESLHRLKELAHAMRDALAAGKLDAFGELLDRAWRQKRSLSEGISSDAIDHWYAAAIEAGALGGKITGAGGGGHLLLYVPPERQMAVRLALAGYGLRETPFSFDYSGARVMTSEAQQDSVRGATTARESADLVAPDIRHSITYSTAGEAALSALAGR